MQQVSEAAMRACHDKSQLVFVRCVSQDLQLDRRITLEGCGQLVCCSDDIGLVLGENIEQTPAHQADKALQTVDYRRGMATWLDMLWIFQA